MHFFGQIKQYLSIIIDLYIFPLISITCNNIYYQLTSMILIWYLCFLMWREFESRSWRSVLDTILCDNVCQWLETGLVFSGYSGFLHHYISEILLKVVLNTITLTLLWHNNDSTDYYQILDKPTIIDRFYSIWIFIASSISGFAFDAILLWVIYSHNTNQQ